MKTSDEDLGDEPLEKEEATRFRAITARVSFLSLDRPELMYATKEDAATWPIRR